MKVDEAITELEGAKSDYRCADLVRLLESLGFTVQACRTKHHKKVKHIGLPQFPGTGFSCGHGRNPQVKRRYIENMKKVIETWKDELENLL